MIHEQERLGAWRPEPSDLCVLDNREDSVNSPAPQPRRLDRVGQNVGRTLALLRCCDQPGHADAWRLADGLSTFLCARLGPRERLFLAVSAVEALDPDTRQDLAFALDPWPFDGDDPFAERNRQRCADAFLALPQQDRCEFMAMARVLA